MRPSASRSASSAGVARPGHQPEVNPSDTRHHAFLLDVHPGRDLRSLGAGLPMPRGPLGEVAEDRAGLGQAGAVVELEDRGFAQRVEAAELVSEGLPREDGDLHSVVRHAEDAEQHPHLEAVGRSRVGMKAHKRQTRQRGKT